jgi:hypothetical protein
MNDLFKDEKIVDNYSKKSKELAKTLYTKEVYYNKLIDIYTRLVKVGK